MLKFIIMLATVLVAGKTCDWGEDCKNESGQKTTCETSGLAGTCETAATCKANADADEKGGMGFVRKCMGPESTNPFGPSSSISIMDQETAEDVVKGVGTAVIVVIIVCVCCCCLIVGCIGFCIYKAMNPTTKTNVVGAPGAPV